MDRTTFEDINKGKKYFLLLVIIIFVSIGTLIGLFTTNKTETLICSKIENKCIIEKTNLLNIKSKKDLITMSDIGTVTYIPQRVAGNMYASGYSSYFLAFLTKKNEKIKIFSIDYYEKDELNKIILELKTRLKSNENEFRIIQNL